MLRASHVTAALPLLFALSASSPETPATSEAATSEGASATEAEDEAGAGKRKSGQAAVGAHWLFAANKAMPGVSLRVAERLVALDLETSLIWVTERDEAFDATFLGSQFGFYLSLRP
ncbi:MAG TPA: hypothetical protein VGK73_25135, partial [Polyangiaceae bacterium]